MEKVRKDFINNYFYFILSFILDDFNIYKKKEIFKNH